MDGQRLAPPAPDDPKREFLTALLALQIGEGLGGCANAGALAIGAQVVIVHGGKPLGVTQDVHDEPPELHPGAHLRHRHFSVPASPFVAPAGPRQKRPDVLRPHVPRGLGKVLQRRLGFRERKRADVRP